MTRRSAWSLVIIVASGFVLIAANFLFTAHMVNQSQHQWCATLTLLTARPVPRPTNPKANPSRENTYVFYTNLLDLRHRFGCG